MPTASAPVAWTWRINSACTSSGAMVIAQATMGTRPAVCSMMCRARSTFSWSLMKLISADSPQAKMPAEPEAMQKSVS